MHSIEQKDKVHFILSSIFGLMATLFSNQQQRLDSTCVITSIG